MELSHYRKYPQKLKRRARGIRVLASRAVGRKIGGLVAMPMAISNEIHQTIDLFRADWEIDFQLDQEDLRTESED